MDTRPNAMEAKETTLKEGSLSKESKGSLDMAKEISPQVLAAFALISESSARKLESRYFPASS